MSVFKFAKGQRVKAKRRLESTDPPKGVPAGTLGVVISDHPYVDTAADQDLYDVDFGPRYGFYTVADDHLDFDNPLDRLVDELQ